MTATRLADVEVISPAPRDAWQRVAAADPDLFVTQLPEWLDALRAARGVQDASRMYVLPGGRRLILPMAGRSLAGVRLADESWPYGWGYGGLVAEGGELRVDEASLVLADLTRRPVARASVVPMPLLAAVWDAAATASVQRIPYRTHVIDVGAGFDHVWTCRYKKSTRNLVRRAGRAGLDVRREHGGAIVDTFATMYRRSIERWARQRGQPLQLVRWWSRYQDRSGQVAAVSASLGQACIFWSAWRMGEPVAVLVVLQRGQHALSWLTAIDRQLADDTLATYLLQSMAIEDACDHGARHFHLGETDPGSGVELYKTRFGATPLDYQALRLERVPLTAAERHLRRGARAALALRSRLPHVGRPHTDGKE